MGLVRNCQAPEEQPHCSSAPGFDDSGDLGALRVKKTKQVLNKCDAAVLVIDGTIGRSSCDSQLLAIFKEKNIPYVIAYNKQDLAKKQDLAENEVSVSAKTGEGIFELKETIARLIKTDADAKRIVGDLISPGDTVVLVTPIDSAAPKGRLILPHGGFQLWFRRENERRRQNRKRFGY